MGRSDSDGGGGSGNLAYWLSGTDNCFPSTEKGRRCVQIFSMIGSSLVPFGHWLQNRSFALAIADSSWAYPIVQATHFTGISLWVGTNFAVDLSLLGIGNKRQTPAQLSDALFIWNWLGFATAVLGGFLLFSVSAETFVINPAFLVKLGFLVPIALITHIVIQCKIHSWGKGGDMPLVAKSAGSLELLLWFSVATAAVLIPYGPLV